MVLGAFLTPVFTPILHSIGILWFVILISFCIALLTVIIYKYTTDQLLMKNLKEQIAKLQKEAKASMHDQKKAMGIHKQMMDKQMVMFSHSMKSTFITLLPIIILFGWLNANLAYNPLTENTPFMVSVNFDKYTGTAELIVPKGLTIIDNATKDATPAVTWNLKGVSGEYLLEWKINNKSYTKDVIITDEQIYAPALTKINDGIVKSIQINYQQKKILNLLGWRLGWLGTYVLSAIFFSIILRKLLKVY